MKRQTAFASILILLTLVFTAISLKPAFFETTVAVAQTTQPAASGISPASPKDCIARNLPNGVQMIDVDTALKMVWLRSTARLSTRDQAKIRDAVCTCTKDSYSIRNSVTGEDPGGSTLLIITNCKSSELALKLQNGDLPAALSKGDFVRAVVKDRSVTYTGTVSKLATVEAASRAAIDAGAITVINNLKVRKQARK